VKAMEFSVTFAVTSASLADAFRARFEALPRASVVESRWQDLPSHDCFVTAANAYGLMSAGIDAAVVGVLGESVQRTVQLHILNTFLGEQPIGTAFLVPTDSAWVPMLCHAPTMRVPADISETDNVYRATRAALLCIYHHNRQAAAPLQSVVFPAFGAGFGGLSADESARQMAVAWQLFLEPPYLPDWDRVVRRERIITHAGDQRRVSR
jgi:O-acetyl-ADP-ribose deacetylase (regulator of RNase III)